MTSPDRKLEIATKLAFHYRQKALYFDCLAKRRYRPRFEYCEKCKLDTENGEFCDFVQMEIDTMSGRKEDEPEGQKYSGNTKFGKPKRKRPKKRPRDSAKPKR